MKSQLKNLPLPLVLAMVIPASVHAAAIQVNTTCEVGVCTTAALQSSALTPGGSVPLTPFSFTYAAVSGDQFAISGTYSAAFGASGTPLSLAANMSVIYTGVGPDTGDSFTVNVLQDFNGGGPGNWNSPPDYTEHVPATVGNFTTFSFNDCFDSNTACVGAVGPLGPGSYNQTVTTPLTGLTGQYLAENFEFTFDFGPGAPAGAGDTVLAGAPEPVQTIPVALALVGFASAWLIRKRGAKKLC